MVSDLDKENVISLKAVVLKWGAAAVSGEILAAVIGQARELVTAGGWSPPDAAQYFTAHLPRRWSPKCQEC